MSKQVSKECRRCHTVKSIKDFGKAKNTSDKIQVWCRDCMKAYSLANYQKNKAKMDAKRMQLYFDQKARKASFQAHIAPPPPEDEEEE